jgi:hypothetical protein
VSTVDVLILLPLIPLAPVLLTWWLPWEQWLFEKMPQKILNFSGPYFLYAAFAAWHFKLKIWAVLSAIVLAAFCFFAALVRKYTH